MERRETRDRGDDEEPTRAEHAACLAERDETVATIDEVIQRTHHQHNVGRCFRLRQIACIADGRGDTSVTCDRLLDVLRAHAGVDVEPVFAPPRTGDIKHSQADITRARQLLGYSPQVSFTEGLQRTFDWYRSNS